MTGCTMASHQPAKNDTIKTEFKLLSFTLLFLHAMTPAVPQGKRQEGNFARTFHFWWSAEGEQGLTAIVYQQQERHDEVQRGYDIYTTDRRIQ